MGTIYTIPVVQDLDFVSRDDVSWEVLDSQQQTAYNIVHSNGIEVYNGIANYNYSSRTAVMKYAATNTFYFCIYKATFSGIPCGCAVFYCPYSCERYLSRVIDNNLYSVDLFTYSADSYIVATSSATPLESYINAGIDVYENREEAEEAMEDYRKKPITYRLTNCTAPNAPTEAAVGDTVTVPLQFTSGYGVVNPATDAYVTNNGVVIPSQYSNGVLTFTMPNPS